jgi:hypothetical protein
MGVCSFLKLKIDTQQIIQKTVFYYPLYITFATSISSNKNVFYLLFKHLIHEMRISYDKKT